MGHGVRKWKAYLNTQAHLWRFYTGLYTTCCILSCKISIILFFDGILGGSMLVLVCGMEHRHKLANWHRHFPWGYRAGRQLSSRFIMFGHFIYWSHSHINLSGITQSPLYSFPLCPIIFCSSLHFTIYNSEPAHVWSHKNTNATEQGLMRNSNQLCNHGALVNVFLFECRSFSDKSNLPNFYSTAISSSLLKTISWPQRGLYVSDLIKQSEQNTCVLSCRPPPLCNVILLESCFL